MIKPEISISRCGDCGVVERLLIHHVRHRGTFRRLCTSCVLRLHPHSFCPTCFQIYPPAPPNDAAVTCSKCYSSSHSQCTGPTPPPPHPYICPLCVSPNSSIFKLKTSEEVEGSKLLDRESAKKLLAAARIASISMNRAAVAAKAEAERRAREAAVARKRAKEALQLVAYLVMKEKLRKREPGVVVGGPGPGFNMSMGMPRLKVENNGGGSYVVPPPPSMVSAADKMDTSNHVLAALNSVELRESTGMMMMMNMMGSGGDDDGVTDADDDRTADESVEEFIADGSSDNHDDIFADMEVDTKQDDDDDDDDDDVDQGSLDKMLTAKMGSKVNGNKYEDDDEDEEEDDNDDDDDDDDDDNNEADV